MMKPNFKSLHIKTQQISSFFCGFLISLFLWSMIETQLNFFCNDDFISSMQVIRSKIKANSKSFLEIPNAKPSNKIVESHDDNFLFIGIMTARKYLDSRAFASSKTWVSRVPGKVVYFLGEGEEYTGELNVIQLKGVKENDYPPQKKSFAMVQYMSEHFAKDYKWLIRADDDVYMKIDELVRFLKSIDDTKPLYIGQPGFGKPIEEGKLGLAGAFCMGGPGVIMTSKLVTLVAPGLADCLKLTATGHEDTELGRCITINTGVQCTVAFQMKQLFYQNYAELDMPNSSFKKKLGNDEIRALTLHPLKELSYVFRLENFFNSLSFKNLKQKASELKTEIENTEKLIFGNIKQPSNKNVIVDSSLTQYENSYSDSTIFKEAAERGLGMLVNLEQIRLLPKGKSIYHGSDRSWEFIRFKKLFSTTLETGKLELGMEFKRRNELHQEMVTSLKSLPGLTKSNFVNETYQRITANRGVEAMLFVKVWDKKQKYIQPFYLRKPLHSPLVDFREADSGDEEMGDKGKTIYMLMPLFQRSSIYKRFLEMHASAVKGYNGKIELRLVVFIDDRGLMTALSDLPYSSLLLFMDVDMEYSSNFLHRVSKYTVMGKSTFFPIYFVHFNPDSICYQQDDCDTLLNSRRDEVGLWRSFSYGIGAVYKKDLIKAGGFKTNIQGWGLEDVDFFEKCIAHGLEVIRGSDPSMIHRFHPRDCNMSLPENQLQSCLDSGSAMLGSVKNLYKMLNDVSNKKDIYN